MHKIYIILGCIQVFIAIGAIPAGLLFLADTSGQWMGTSTALLENSPFRSYLIPGLFLLIVNGIGNASAAFFSFFRRSVAGITGLALGIFMILWIILQVHWIGFSSFLQPLFFITGIIEAGLGWLIIRMKFGLKTE